jgi:cyclopropane fatty-acyl-phospholipid synthase-like methyltransferase
MTDYKERFYRGYYSTHIAPRKGEVTLDRLRARARMYDRVWAGLLPRDKGARILDVGCGSGSLVWWMQQRGYAEAGGIDVSAEQVEVARALGVRNVEEADLRGYLAERPSWYDRLILRDVLEHFSRDWILDVLDLCRCALRPGGALVVQVQNAEAPLWGRIRYGDFTHEMAFTEGALRQVFGVTGYERVAFHPAGPVLRGVRDVPRQLLWKCLEAVYKVLVFAETGRRRVIVTESIIAMATPVPPGASGA